MNHDYDIEDAFNERQDINEKYLGMKNESSRPGFYFKAHFVDLTSVTYLIIHFSQCWCHFICQRSSNYYTVNLTRRCSKNDTKTIHIISRGCNMHHFYCTTSQAEGQWPKRTLNNRKDTKN